MPGVIAVHDGSCHADDALSVYLLLQHPDFHDYTYIRTRDEEKWKAATIVCDVGKEYDHAKLRYDHHQTDFNAKFPDSKVPLSSCGLVYFHYGKAILTEMINNKFGPLESNFDMEAFWTKFYFIFVEAIDALDNGTSQTADSRPSNYHLHSSLTSRVANLNPHWKSEDPDPDHAFVKALEEVGKDFEFFLSYYYKKERSAWSG
jgi:uncharacterized UPF0160 family protein